MSISVNSVVLGGNATRAPEQRQAGQTTVAGFGIAINRKFTVNGEKREEVTFVDVTCFGKLAEIVCKYVNKGDQLIVLGRLKTESWEKDGQKRSKLVLIADSVQFVGGKDRSEASEARNNPAPANTDDQPDF